MPPLTLQGAALREHMRRLRRSLNASTRISASERLAGQLLSISLIPQSGNVAGYWAVDGEIALHAWQVQLPPDVTYCLPVLHQDGMLQFAPWAPGAPLLANKHGIPEPDVSQSALLMPEAMAAVIAPLVSFDAAGHRLGMGGGWYDRSFAFNSAEDRMHVPLIGVGYALQQVDAIDQQPWDVVLDAICTDQRAFAVSAPESR